MFTKRFGYQDIFTEDLHSCLGADGTMPSLIALLLCHTLRETLMMERKTLTRGRLERMSSETSLEHSFIDIMEKLEQRCLLQKMMFLLRRCTPTSSGRPLLTFTVSQQVLLMISGFLNEQSRSLKFGLRDFRCQGRCFEKDTNGWHKI